MGRRGAVRNGADGVEAYSEASIGASNKAYTKIIPQNFLHFPLDYSYVFMYNVLINLLDTRGRSAYGRHHHIRKKRDRRRGGKYS